MTRTKKPQPVSDPAAAVSIHIEQTVNMIILPQPDTRASERKQPDPEREPGTLGEQLAAIGISLALAEDRGTTAQMQWTDALQLSRCVTFTLVIADQQAAPDASDDGWCYDI